MLFGTAVNANLANVNVGGGAGGDGTGLGGGNGHFILGNNTTGTATGSAVGAASSTSVAGSTGTNPFVAPSTVTPYIPTLVNGAEVYGLADATLNQTSLGALFGGSLPATDLNGTSLLSAGAALIRIPLGAVAGTSYGNSFAGYDLLVMLNLTANAIGSPSMGLDGVNQSLITQGFALNPTFGGSGPVVAGSLGGGVAYATLVPAGADPAQLSADFGAGVVTATSVFGPLANSGTNGITGGSNQVLYLAVPEPSTFVLAWLGSAVAFMVYRRRRRA